MSLMEKVGTPPLGWNGKDSENDESCFYIFFSQSLCILCLTKYYSDSKPDSREYT